VAPPPRPFSDPQPGRPEPAADPPTRTEQLPGALGNTLGLPSTVTTTTPQVDLPGVQPAGPDGGRDRSQDGGARATGAQPSGGQDTRGPESGPATGRLEQPLGYPERTNWERRALILVLCALLGSGVGVVAQHLFGGRSAGPVVTSTASPSPSPVQATITSFDPVGSGFRRQGQNWTSQTYNSAKFGNLKPGIGLLVDLGSAKALRAITVTAVNGPLTIELRTADAAATSADGFQKVGAAVQASGATTLPAGSGGKHRYWLVWVTGLAAANGGFTAVLSPPVAQT
jgi:hypothetical protein